MFISKLRNVYKRMLSSSSTESLIPPSKLSIYENLTYNIDNEYHKVYSIRIRSMIHTYTNITSDMIIFYKKLTIGKQCNYKNMYEKLLIQYHVDRKDLLSYYGESFTKDIVKRFIVEDRIKKNIEDTIKLMKLIQHKSWVDKIFFNECGDYDQII